MTYTVNCSILLTELPLLERPAAAKAAGFDAVEFWWPFETSVPTDAEVTRFERAITDAGVQLTGLNFNAGDMPGRRPRPGLLAGPLRRIQGQHRRRRRHRRAPRLQGLQRPLRQPAGRRTPLKRRTSWRSENLAAAAAGVARIGGTVLLEPVSGAPRYPLLTADDALRVIARVKAGIRRGEHQAPRRLLSPVRQR